MKVLVTGANGYIGRFVVKRLIDLGYTVCALDFNHDKVDDRAEKLSYNIFSNEENIFEKLQKPDVLLHMAWRDGFSHGSEAHLSDLSNHYIFIKNMIKGGLKRLAVMGTMHEVGYFEGGVNENTPCNPISNYGIAKDCLRRALILMCKENNVSLRWLRAYYISGDDGNNHSIFTKILNEANSGKTKFPFTSGTNKYDFIDVFDLADQIAKSVIQNEVDGIINCCSGQPVMLKDKVNEFIKKNNLKIELDYGVFKDRPYDSPIIYGDNTKINQILNSFK